MANKLEVNGEVVGPLDVRARAAQMRREREAAGVILDLEQRIDLQEKALAVLVDRTLLVQEAGRLGLAPGDAELTALLLDRGNAFESREDLKRQVMVDRILDRWRASVGAPRGEELRRYYRENKEQFSAPELIHASHFVRAGESEEVVRNARESILAGEDFAAVAVRLSDCPENGGDLGWFARGVMVAEFDHAVFTSPIRQLTPIFRTVFGFHFAIVHARTAEGIRPFNDVLPEVTRSVLLLKQDREVGLQLTELRARARIKVIR